MHVSQDPSTFTPDAVAHVVRALSAAERLVPVISGAVGMGKSAVLRSAARRFSERDGAQLIVIPSGEIAGEPHLDKLIAERLGVPSPARPTSADDGPSEFVRMIVRASLSQRIVLAVDDVDQLLYKRPAMLGAIRDLLAAEQVRLACTVGADTMDRLAGPRGLLTQLAPSRLTVITLDVLPVAAAVALARRRNPALTTRELREVAFGAGGHPAAIAFLARFAALGLCRRQPSQLLTLAADFAGHVYGGPWASLGPQQRAIMIALASTPEAQTAASVSLRLTLPSSHVSAQLSRLRAEGMISSERRGHFRVAPLLFAWLRQHAPAALGDAAVTASLAVSGGE